MDNITFRTVFPTHQRNDQRNGNFWGIDAQVVKRFAVGKVQASASPGDPWRGAAP